MQELHDPSCESALSSRAEKLSYSDQAPIEMPIGITLILIVYKEQQFDARILNMLLIARYHPIRKETCFLVVIANSCYYKFERIKMK